MSKNNNSSSPRVAFVVQRSGAEVNGGAESHCLQVATRMAKHWDTEILTTCALDYMTWENFYPEGVDKIGATKIRRFRVDQPRDVEAFNRLSAELHGRQARATLGEQENWMKAQGPMSSALLDYLRQHRESYDLFIFVGYLYATTYFGLPLVAERAWLAPLAHDEWTIYFSMWDEFFSLPRALLFNTTAEREFFSRRFPGKSAPGPVVGLGIEAPGQIRVEDFKSRYGLTGPYLLYAGRIDESKGCATMLAHFLRWKKEVASPHKLVLLGKEVMPVPFHDDVLSLGYVDESEKWAAMKGCEWLVMPSQYESLSLALLETWSVGRPALVNAHSPVLVRHCQDANAGLWYENFNEWAAALAGVDEPMRRILGRQGTAYVRERYSWDRVEAGYLELLKGKQ